MKLCLTISILAICFAPLSCNKEKQSESHHEDEGRSSVGEGKAVSKADEKLGIQLPKKTLHLLKIKVKPLNRYRVARNRLYLPKSSLVFFENQVGFYYHRNGWYNLMVVDRIHSRSRTHSTVSVSSLRNDDKLIVNGVALLRLAYLEAFGASGDGHGH